MIVIANAEKLLTDGEFPFLYEANKPANLDLPYYEYEEFNLEENISEAECKAEFRFERGDIERLADVLQLPPTFECPQGSVCDRIEGLCILLRRPAYPCRYSDSISRCCSNKRSCSFSFNFSSCFLTSSSFSDFSLKNCIESFPPLLFFFAGSS